MTQPYRAGSRVEKVNSKPGDMHQDGARGRIISHAGLLTPGTILGNGEIIETDEYGYFVQWEDFPVHVFIRGCRVREVI